MEIVLKQFQGYSGSQVFLVQQDDFIFIRKINNIERNYERLTFLEKMGYNVPKIYKKENNLLEMEYINGLDMKTYLTLYGIDSFYKNICQLINRLKFESFEKDYTKTYYEKLNWFDVNDDLNFTKKELIDSLPKILPSSVYHGDTTLENIIYKNNKFYLIDAATIEYDSWVFDVSKMRQDIHCGWFIRNQNDKNIKKYTNIIEQKILDTYPITNNNSLLILMLLRVFRYAQNEQDKKFLIEEMNKLWK